MDSTTKYIVATLPDGTIYKVPIRVILNKIVQEFAQDSGISIQRAHQKMEEVHDEFIMDYSKPLDYHFLNADAIKITHAPGMSFKEGWPQAHLEIQTQKEVDNLLVNTNQQ